MTQTTIAAIFMATILLTVTVVPDSFAAPTWSATGPGTVTVTDADQGDDGVAQFTYEMNPAGFSTRTWTFETTATQDETVTLFYDYQGFHAFFAVTAFLQSFDDAGPVTIINAGPVNCCSPPSNGFHYTGSVTFDVVAGETYGFNMGGKNFDRDNRLLGTFTVSFDSDGDGVSDFTDNCVDTPNADQTDSNNNGIGDACENKPPVVTASLEPLCGEEDEGLFTVVIDVIDDNDANPNVVAQLNGISVTNGQVVELEISDEPKSELDDGVLEIEDSSFSLVVTATDSAGESTSVTTSPSFDGLDECPDDEDSDDEDSDDEDSDDEDSDDEDSDDEDSDDEE